MSFEQTQNRREFLKRTGAATMGAMAAGAHGTANTAAAANKIEPTADTCILLWMAGGMAALGLAAGLILTAFNDSLVFFYSPSEIAEKVKGPDQRVRLGGLVEMDSMAKSADGLTVTFRVTDMAETVPVTFTGLLPDLFREGQGVVAEGVLKDGVFMATDVLAKHDENYMPPEVADALKKSGQWQGNVKESKK